MGSVNFFFLKGIEVFDIMRFLFIQLDIYSAILFENFFKSFLTLEEVPVVKLYDLLLT